jgi:uncharacterized damage-inducible protein DinB
MADVIRTMEEEFRRYKALGESAIAQLPEHELSREGPGGGNSIATLVWHVSGNLASRFTDFLSSDGEKPWRDRDDEFVPRVVTRPALLARWASGWTAVLGAIAALSDADLDREVVIRQQPLTVAQALSRSLAHTVYHVGQIVYLSKTWRGEQWENLSIPLGGSRAYNAAPTKERPSAHVASLSTPWAPPEDR